MPDLINVFDEFEKKIGAMNKTGYGQRPIPCQLDDEVSKLVRVFVSATEEQRELVISMITRELGRVLIVFSKRMAALAVRERSREILREGLVALAIESWSFDGRQNVVALSLLYHSALKLNIDSKKLFSEASKFAKKEIVEKFTKFLERSEYDKSIEAMGYKEKMAEDGFRYECTW